MGPHKTILAGAGVALLLSAIAWISMTSSPPAPARPIGAIQTNYRILGRPDVAPPQPRFGLGFPRALRPLPSPPALRLESAEATLQTQLDVLSNGTEESFRQTFLPEVRGHVSAEAIDACRQLMRNTPPKPDWSTARDTTDGQGRATKLIALSGKGAVGFHLVDGQWLADTIWCD